MASEKVIVNLEEIKAEVVGFVEEVKEELNSIQNFDDGFRLFSELMKTLRDKKDMKLLLLCRQIQKIEIANKKANIIAEDVVLDEICHNQELFNELKHFFNSYGLSLKINNFETEATQVEILREWLGKKLKIKN